MYNIKDLRKSNNLSQRDMADILGISKSGYAGKEIGNREFKTHEAIKISNLFNVPIEEVENFLPPSSHKENSNLKSA